MEKIGENRIGVWGIDVTNKVLKLKTSEPSENILGLNHLNIWPNA